MELTLDQLRKIVFETSVIYHRILDHGGSIQQAEWARNKVLEQELESLPKR